VERGGVEELRRDGAAEGVGVEVEAAEVEERAELRREVAAEALAGERDPDDSRFGEAGDVRARDAGPLARRGVGVVPVGERGGAGGIHGRLQSEKRDAVGGERNGGMEKEEKEKKDEQTNGHLE